MIVLQEWLHFMLRDRERDLGIQWGMCMYMYSDIVTV